MEKITNIHASGLSRVMTCSGSLMFDLPREPSSESAKEGTACGEYLEHLLKGNQNIGTHAKNGVFFDEDMKFFANETAKEIEELSNSPVNAEIKVDWQTRSGIWIKGRYDASFTSASNTLYVDDFKYGWTLVDVKENWQLLAYAIGEIMRQGVYYETITLRIHQPRPHHEEGPIRSWELTYDELLAYKEKIEVRMDQIAQGITELVTSPKCKYCPAAAFACTAFNRAVYASVDYTLSDFEQDNLEDREISQQLDLLDRVTDVLKIKTDSMKQLAISRIKEGKIIPGYLTEDSYGNRDWKKDVSPNVIEVLTGLNITETKMLSPAKAEKIGVPKELVASFVERAYKGQNLVKRDAGKLADKIFNK